jgi:hypothetical protein
MAITIRKLTGAKGMRDTVYVKKSCSLKAAREM